MGLFEVVLEVVKGARDTGKRVTMTVLGVDRLSAAIAAEQRADELVPDPATMYSHALSVTPVGHAVTSAALPAAA